MWKFALAPVTALLLLGGCAAGTGAAMEPPPVPGPPETAQLGAAQQGLATFRSLVTPQNYRGLGFASPDDIGRAELGTPLPFYRIELEALRRYTPNTPAQDLLVNAQRSLYPVMVDGRVASSIFVTGHNDGWRATDFGNADLARATSAMRRVPSDIVVQIPAAKLTFIARGQGADMTLTPVMDDPRFGFRAGQALPASRVLPIVQRGMADYNGLPQ
ncbi:MAG: hypothetical protein JO264_08630 [Acidisphaera sp.]|nr:hypothetical protein [Acidisphaera sp.]